MAVNLESVKQEVMNFMDKGKYLKPAKLLYAAFRSIGQTEVTTFGDLMVDLARKYPELFIEKIYIAFQFQLPKKSPHDILYKLEKYIIENHCLIGGENISDFFYGSLSDKYNIIGNGSIFLTNLRLIASGYPTPISKSPMAKSWGALRKDLVHIAIGRAIRRALNKDVKDVEIIPYGFYYPIYNAYKIKREKSAVSYNVDIEYERKGKTKIEKLSIRVSPGKMKEDLARKEEILSKIETLLIQNQ